MHRRWAPVSGGVAFMLVLGSLLVVPADAGRLVRSTYADMPAVSEGAQPLASTWDAWVDDAVRFFAFGSANRLVSSDLRLVAANPAPGAWAGSRNLNLEWTDLRNSGIQYEVRVGRVGTAFSDAALATLVPTPGATVTVPGDGDFNVWVRPVAGHAGRVSTFGPFRVDASPPPPPIVTLPAEPPGYRFEVRWTPVTDLSGLTGYELERRQLGSGWQRVAATVELAHSEDQVGSGAYEYRVRGVNGAGVASEWSTPARVTVRAPMSNPGPGTLTYGLHANYTGFIHLWDLSDPDKYTRTSGVPLGIQSQYLRAEPRVEVDNDTLRVIVKGVVGSETNTMRIAEKLFIFLFDHADYDSVGAADPEHPFQRAGLTLDRGLGICGDLAVLYTTLLRIAGVPARPVHGYLDNALSGIGGFHMWVEVYVGPNDAQRPWMTVDVSGVTGTFEPADLFPYFGVFNPDYLALGNELNYDRFTDGQWNTWARFRYSYTGTKPNVTDEARVSDYESEFGRLFFDETTKATMYVACKHPDASSPEDPCPSEQAPPGFHQFYGAKGASKKRIDFGARLNSPLPSCLKVELRYPVADQYGAVVADQSSIYNVYENSASPAVKAGAPDPDGWLTFLDGTKVPDACTNL